jgi:hypothetical protein
VDSLQLVAIESPKLADHLESVLDSKNSVLARLLASATTRWSLLPPPVIPQGAAAKHVMLVRIHAKISSLMPVGVVMPNYSKPSPRRVTVSSLRSSTDRDDLGPVE